jgi:hypothetical protein
MTINLLSLASRALASKSANISAWLSVMVLILLATQVVSAQYQNQVRTYSQDEVEQRIRDVEQTSKQFQRDFDVWLDRSPLDGQEREDRYNRQVRELTQALGTLRSNFDRRNDWWLARSDMQQVLNAATVVNSSLNNREVGRNVQRQWNRLRRNINRLCEVFNLPQVGSNYDITRPVYPDQGGRNCITGTFRGFTSTGESELTILSNGRATVRSLTSGATYDGQCSNNVLYFDWGAFNVTRDGRGITTTEVNNQWNRTSYRRVAGQDADFGQGYPAPVGNVPNWAVGTFRGMTDGGEAELTIQSDGGAIARSLSNNTSANGNYSNGLLTFAWGSFRVVREGRNIRTINVNNEQNQTLYRRVD